MLSLKKKVQKNLLCVINGLFVDVEKQIMKTSVHKTYTRNSQFLDFPLEFFFNHTIIGDALNAGILRERVKSHNAIFKPHKRPAILLYTGMKNTVPSAEYKYRTWRWCDFPPGQVTKRGTVRRDCEKEAELHGSLKAVVSTGRQQQ